MLKTPWEVNKSIYDLMNVDTDMYIKPDVESEEIIGINMYKALKDIYTRIREDKEEGLRWLDELGRMIVVGALAPSKAQEFAFWFQQLQALAFYQLQVQRVWLGLRAY